MSDGHLNVFWLDISHTTHNAGVPAQKGTLVGRRVDKWRPRHDTSPDSVNSPVLGVDALRHAAAKPQKQHVLITTWSGHNNVRVKSHQMHNKK